MLFADSFTIPPHIVVGIFLWAAIRAFWPMLLIAAVLFYMHRNPPSFWKYLFGEDPAKPVQGFHLPEPLYRFKNFSWVKDQPALRVCWTDDRVFRYYVTLPEDLAKSINSDVLSYMLVRLVCVHAHGYRITINGQAVTVREENSAEPTQVVPPITLRAGEQIG